MSTSPGVSQLPAAASRPATAAGSGNAGKSATQGATEAADTGTAKNTQAGESETPFDQVLSSQTPASSQGQGQGQSSEHAATGNARHPHGKALPSTAGAEEALVAADPLLVVMPPLTAPSPPAKQVGNDAPVPAQTATLLATNLSAAMQQAIHAKIPGAEPATTAALPTAAGLPGLQPTLPAATVSRLPTSAVQPPATAPQFLQGTPAAPPFADLAQAQQLLAGGDHPAAAHPAAPHAGGKIPIIDTPASPAPLQAAAMAGLAQLNAGSTPATRDAAAINTTIDGIAPLLSSAPSALLHTGASLQQPPATTGTLATSAPVVAMPADPANGFDDGFSRHVSLMAEQRISHAEIRVSPEHLGAINIRLQLDGNEIRAEFHSAHADVRHTLESSLPKLRDMLGQHGFQLAHAGVGQEQKPQQEAANPNASQTGDAAADSSEADTFAAPVSRRANGLLDVYA